MGVVYLAEQGEPVRRQVALKILGHALNTNEVVVRFQSEQQTLAMMEHPNIRRVYDAGVTESGLPYFVMEYVVGRTITEHAATRRLSIRERISVFIQVCRAVQHAHQKGTIHRDIKPSNVIVTDADGEPLCKVIDFGIAKAIAPVLEGARLTMTGMARGALAYMSPEQFLSDGTDIDTRADIYALGAMVYELLAYRAGKFTRRRRVGVAFAATGWFFSPRPRLARQSRPDGSRARAVAVARQGQAEDLIGFRLGDLRNKLTVMGRLDVLDSVGARALVYFAAVPASQLSDEELFRRAQALQQLGEVRMSQGKLTDAGHLMGESFVISERLALRDSLNGGWQIGLAHSQFWAGNVDWELGSIDSALDQFVPFVTISRRLIARYPDSLEYREELAYALNNIGFAKEANGDIRGQPRGGAQRSCRGAAQARSSLRRAREPRQ